MQTEIQWLLNGDPSIRWQVQRDLLDAESAIYDAERAQVALTGWGKRLLAKQTADGNWGGGLYTPKWTSTTYTLLLLRDMGLPHDNAGGSAAPARISSFAASRRMAASTFSRAWTTAKRASMGCS